MKYLLFFTYNQGYLSQFYQEIASNLIAEGNSVDVFFLKSKKTRFTKKGVNYYGRARKGYAHNYFQIFRAIKKSSPDIVISNFSYINPALLFGKLLGVKKNIAWVHTVYGHQQPTRLKVFNKRLYLKLADKVITNSKRLKKEMEIIYRVNSNKISSIPFWTNIESNQSEDINVFQTSDFKIGCPGRLVEDKNHKLVLHAVNNISKINKGARIYIAGSGPNDGKLRQLYKTMGLGEKVQFLGGLSKGQMKSFYNAMDLVVLPSLNESFGLVFIEAAAMGVPILVSKMFGALDYIDNKKHNLAQFIFNPKSEKELQEKLLNYMRGEGLSGSYFKALYAETFKKKHIYKQFKDIVENDA